MRLYEFDTIDDDDLIMFEYVNTDSMQWGKVTKQKTSNGKYNMEAKGDHSGLSIRMYDPESDLPYHIAEVDFTVEDSKLKADYVRVNEKYRGQQLAKEMYRFAYDLGNQLTPSSVQLPDGERMWKKFRKDKEPFAKETAKEKISRNLNSMKNYVKDKFS